MLTAWGRGGTARRRCWESLAANADVIREEGKPRLTDPMVELYLRARGLTPASGADDDDAR
jgi:hypothetical protein